MTNTLLYPMEEQLQQKVVAATNTVAPDSTEAEGIVRQATVEDQSTHPTTTSATVMLNNSASKPLTIAVTNLPTGQVTTNSVELGYRIGREVADTDRLADISELVKSANTPTFTSAVQAGKQIFSEKQRYFTFEGQHRKFYSAARYLRSVQRQRRHKRRVTKKVKEREHWEVSRLQNALSYGSGNAKLCGHATATDQRVARERDTNEDGASGDLSLTSHNSTEDGIQLVCWKDIDLDLEVRSINDELELAELIKKGAVEEDELNVPTAICNPRKSFLAFNGTQLTGLNRFVEEHQKHSRETPAYRTMRVNHSKGCPKPTPTLLKKGYSQRKSISEGLARFGDFRVQNKAAVHQRLPTNSPSMVFCNTAALALERRELENPKSSTIPHSQNTKINRLLNEHKIVLKNSEVYNKSYFQQLLHDTDEPRSSAYLADMNDWCLPMGHMRNSCSFQQTQSLLQSTVISNPVACDKRLYETWVGRRENLGKSRLSMASSLGELNSDVLVQLSYYSQQASSRCDEDLSFFSYRDGFSSSEDLSKITVPISLSLLIMLTYILIGAMVFSIWEEREYIKWSYFCFITLSTIGFGDIVPGTKVDSENPSEKLIIISLYVAIGLSVFAMCFKLMQEEVVDKMKWLAFKVGNLTSKHQGHHPQEKAEKSL